MNSYKLNNGRTLYIEYCDYADSPREWDNMSKLICFHRRYNLGDKHTYSHEDYDNWDDMQQAISKQEDVAIILPLYLYDHSGVTISTTPFSCHWDSGQVGFAIVSKDTIRQEYGIKNVTKKYKDKAMQILLAEVETYDQYISGEVYRFVVEDSEGDEEDSCSGFYGSDIRENGILEHLSREDAELVLEQL